MEERYINQDEEFINAYGVPADFVEQGKVQDEYVEDVNNENFNEDNDGFTIWEAKKALNELNLSEEELIEWDAVVNEQNKVYECINSGNVLEEDIAKPYVVASAFASAPTSDEEQENPSAFRLLLGGASRGAKVAVLAALMMLPMVSQGKNKQGHKTETRKETVYEDPAITAMVDNLFGKDIFERMGGKRDRYKALYAKLEIERRELKNQLNNEEYIVPRSTEEKAAFAHIESVRDAKLKEIHIHEVELNQENLRADSKDPLVIAKADAKRAAFAEMKAKVNLDFEDQILRAHNSRSTGRENEATYAKIHRIESQQEDILNRQRMMETRSFYFH